MGESKGNARSNDYRGPVGPNYTVGFKVIHAPSESWVSANREAIDAGNAPDCPVADQRLGIMLCLLEVVKSPLKMVPDQTMVHPCAVVFHTSVEAFNANKMSPQVLEANSDNIAAALMAAQGQGEGALPTQESPSSESTTEPLQVET